MLLAVLVEHLHEGADQDRHEEGNDEYGNGAAKKRFGDEETIISWLSYRLCQSLDRIGLDTRTRRVNARH
jgi:hypothetical protein